ncbi:hypothetical protein O1611_g3102 [Lasiodiplodia mahajangana]|uniref:Uncharacterized protein n=1 Tax=Lasiodiplodia mahajangana TaxID=1108764 RepID=A0ACC2JSR6_9PEZI|nr:hypothetical protein O1611_g3102 [Lasiodiplodia mahajangana]
MSQVYRDLVIDFSITTVSPKDALIIRNSVQAVIRALLSLKSETSLFKPPTGNVSGQDNSSHEDFPEFIIEMDKFSGVQGQNESQEIIEFVIASLAAPTEGLLQSIRFALKSCDAALMDMCGYRRYLGPPYTVSGDVHSALVNLREHIAMFNTRQEQVLTSDQLSHPYAKIPNVLEILAFCRPIHQAASSVEYLAAQLDELRQRQPKYSRFHLPSYPFRKAIHRTNAQKPQRYREAYKKIKSRDFHPLPKKGTPADEHDDNSLDTMTADDLSNSSESRETRLRQRTWTLLHRLQGFETRFGLKTALVTSLLALPAYLAQSHFWWDRYEGWWGVVMGWLIMGPRTGGNIQDLFTRVFCAVLGSLWAGLAYAAGNGNPYVIAVFAAIYMLPMLYRYTQSTHPRSGMVGCISFTVISLAEISVSDVSLPDAPPSEMTKEAIPPVAGIAATRGAIMIFGVIASIIVNWILWPFVARHDLRKGLASMIFNCSIVYRCIISQYVYYEKGDAPTEQDIEASESLEGLLREGFVRLRQLLGLTRHEIRLRAAFDPLPYSALISACEQFFDHLITVRQSSLFYHPHSSGDDSEATMDLLSYRRDEIATVLTNLYILAGALRANRPVPKYLPNTAVARKRLLDRMFELESEHAAGEIGPSKEKQRDTMLEQTYNYSFNNSLTGCVEQVKQLEKYTKIIVGEQGFDCDFAKITTSALTLLSLSTPSLAWEWGKSGKWSQVHEHKSTINYTTIGGFFLQDDTATDPKTFDYTTVNYGLINRTYPTDRQFDRSGKKTQWERFEYYVNTLNRNADKDTQYKVLFMARHGEGYHNAAESYYGTPAWNFNAYFDIHNLYGVDLSFEDQMNYFQPFPSECRAYGRLKEFGREDLAIPCHGYVILNKTHVDTLRKSYTDIEWYSYWGLNLNRESDRNRQLQALVKDFVQIPEYDYGENLRHTINPRTARKAIKDLKTLHQLGICSGDIHSGNFIFGKHVEFSYAWTAPHPFLTRRFGDKFEPLWRYRDDTKGIDELIDTWNRNRPGDQISIRCEPNWEYRYKLRRIRRDRIWDAWGVNPADFEYETAQKQFGKLKGVVPPQTESWRQAKQTRSPRIIDNQYMMVSIRGLRDRPEKRLLFSISEVSDTGKGNGKKGTGSDKNESSKSATKVKVNDRVIEGRLKKRTSPFKPTNAVQALSTLRNLPNPHSLLLIQAWLEGENGKRLSAEEVMSLRNLLKKKEEF